jgi:autotransporter-associated beta strand protein
VVFGTFGGSGTLNIGAASGQAAAAPGALTAPTIETGTGAGAIVFNHTSANYSFAPTIGGSVTVEVDAGTTILTAANTYSGATTINGGILTVTGSIASSAVTVNTGGTLGGTGTVGATQINAGGTFAPGDGTANSSINVATSLSFQAAAIFMVQVNPATASFANVSGTAALGGATVNATFAAGSYVSKQYTIVQATGIVSGTFNPTVVNTNLPSNFHTTLSYDSHDAYLNLALNFAIPGGLNGNPQSVGNALTHFFNATGGIPMLYSSLTPSGLSQASGETATGSQQTTFNAMTQFMGVMTDPFVAGRSDGINAGASATPFAEEANGYAAKGPARSQSERDAYAAIYNKAPAMAAPFVPSWSVWAAAYGGSQTTNGNATVGSNSSTSRLGGVAVGADYRFSPNTIAGFALAGGGTNFSVNGFGTGRSDLFQAGAFVRHTVGPAYFTAALAYGWQDVTTDRTVTIAGIDQLRARFNANAFSGRVEDGYRFATPWMGVTPYAAAQFTTFDLPSYTEQAIVGSNAFALAYGAKSATDTRSEVGLRTDKSWAMPDSIFTLRGRFAWAHDYNSDRSIGATFQALPGASFVVNGAAQAPDKALTTASAEVRWQSGISLAATFEGEFSGNSTSYAGKGVARYQW